MYVFVGWPELYICTVYDRIFGDFPAKTSVYTPSIFGSGQPYKYAVYIYIYIYSVMANPSVESTWQRVMPSQLIHIAIPLGGCPESLVVRVGQSCMYTL